MFSKISAFLHQAAEATSQVLSPLPSRHDEFQAHWKAITDAMTSDNDMDSTVESTGITPRLDQMVEQLCAEDEEKDPRDPGTMGPCMEFVLRHKILDTLYTTAKSDYPPGMTHQVLLFYTVLLGRIERPLLHHVSVHQPIVRQITNCGSSQSPRLAADEVQFLRTICLRLQRDPRLADFFIEDYKGSKTKKCFVLVEALLRLVNSEDSLVVIKAYECLLTCISLQHLTVSQALADSQLPMLLASKLQYHFQLIPPSTHHSSIIGCHAGWGVDYAVRSHTVDHSPSTYGLWHVEALLSWLDYCEQVVGLAQPVLSDAVCGNIHEMVLTATLLPKLIKTISEEEILISTAVLTKMIQSTTCRRLLQELVVFTLHDSYSVGDTRNLLRDVLISRTNHHSDEICQVTLQLFDVLISSPLPSVINDLILVHWSGSHQVEYIVLPDKLQEEREGLQKLVEEYLALMPEGLNSCRHVSRDEVGLEQYLVDAHHQVAKYRALSMVWSSQMTAEERSSLEQRTPSLLLSQSNEQMAPSEIVDSHCSCEGVFLSSLLNKLETMLDQTYEINLLLTSILSSLASFPHPMIDWLYGTHTPQDHRNVFSSLVKVSSILRSHAERSPGMLVNIVEARRRLAGQETSDLLSMPHNDLLEGAIILEEFTKELASILFARKTSSLLALPPP